MCVRRQQPTSYQRKPPVDRYQELHARFIEALGGPNNTSQHERDGVVLAASLIVAYEEKRKAFAAAEYAALEAKALAKIALDSLNLPGSAAHMLDTPGLT
jgi:hypothetical protein